MIRALLIAVLVPAAASAQPEYVRWLGREMREVDAGQRDQERNNLLAEQVRIQREYLELQRETQTPMTPAVPEFLLRQMSELNSELTECRKVVSAYRAAYAARALTSAEPKPPIPRSR